MKSVFRPPNWLFILVLTIFAAQLFGQNIKNSKPVYRYALKAYLDFSHEKKSETETDPLRRTTTLQQNETQISPLIGVVNRKRKGIFTEISLTYLNFRNDDTRRERSFWVDTDSLGNQLPTPRLIKFANGEKTKTRQIGIRWEWSFPLFYNKMGRFQPFIGVATAPSLFYEKNDPFFLASFPTRIIEARNTVSIIPRLDIALSSRLFLDVQCPISAFSMATTYKNVDNPILPTYARESLGFSSSWLPSVLNFRVGVGYKI